MTISKKQARAQIQALQRRLEELRQIGARLEAELAAIGYVKPETAQAIQNYAGRMRSPVKRHYAEAIARWVIGGQQGPEPERPAQLSRQIAASVQADISRIMLPRCLDGDAAFAFDAEGRMPCGHQSHREFTVEYGRPKCRACELERLQADLARLTGHQEPLGGTGKYDPTAFAVNDQGRMPCGHSERGCYYVKETRRLVCPECERQRLRREIARHQAVDAVHTTGTPYTDATLKRLFDDLPEGTFVVLRCGKCSGTWMPRSTALAGLCPYCGAQPRHATLHALTRDELGRGTLGQSEGTPWSARGLQRLARNLPDEAAVILRCGKCGSVWTPRSATLAGRCPGCGASPEAATMHVAATREEGIRMLSDNAAIEARSATGEQEFDVYAGKQTPAAAETSMEDVLAMLKDLQSQVTAAEQRNAQLRQALQA